ncbi:MAG: MFS transporter [Pirellulales bacterium]
MKPSAWRLVVLLAAICFTGHFNRVSMAVAGDLRIMPDYGISPQQMGFVYSAFLFAYTLAMIPGGWLIDRAGPRFSLALMCLGSAVFVLFTGIAGQVVASATALLAALFVVRSLMGVVSAPMHPAAANAVSWGVPLPWRAAANGLVTGAALLGIACTYFVFGGLIERFSWPAAFLVTGGCTAVLGILWELLARGTTSERSDRTGATTHVAVPPTAKTVAVPLSPDRAPVVRYKNLLLLTGSYGAVGYFQYLFFYWMHYYFESVLHLGSEQSKVYAAIPPLAMALGMPLGGWLSDRLLLAFGWRAARPGLAMAAMSASAALLLLGIRAEEPAWIVTWLSLALGVLGMAEGPFWVTAVEVGGARGGLSAAIFNTGGNAGGILAPIVTPWISETLGYGWQAGIAVGSGVGLAGALAWLWINPADDALAEPVPAVPSMLGG